jgi:hypothetical protein
MVFQLSVFCSRRPIELDKPHILAKATETGFLQFKEQVPLIVQIKYQRFNENGRPLD